MVFKKEISIDGVAVIVATFGLCAWLVTMKNTQDAQGRAIMDHSQELKEIHALLVQEQLKSEITDGLNKRSDDHENRIRVLEQRADYSRIPK